VVALRETDVGQCPDGESLDPLARQGPLSRLSRIRYAWTWRGRNAREGQVSILDGTTSLTGILKNGQVILDKQADWPEGCRVVVVRESAVPLLGMVEDEQGDDPESIARWIAAFDAIPPLEMTPEEEAEWQAAREANKAYEVATFDERAKRIEALFP
jgi:hypothetical protein